MTPWTTTTTTIKFESHQSPLQMTVTGTKTVPMFRAGCQSHIDGH
jgi:hypothetical protein